MEAVSEILDTLLSSVRSNPVRAILLSNAATATIAAYLLAQQHGGLKKALITALIKSVAAVPGVAGLIDDEMEKMGEKIKKGVLSKNPEGDDTLALPAEGKPSEEIKSTLARWAAEDMKLWKNGRVSGAVYHGGQALTDVIAEAFRQYALANPLHPDVFPSCRKMEAEVVSMTLRLFHAGESAVGNMTSGGTESILMACKAYRDYAENVRGITEPEMVVPTTIHAAFDKACNYFRIKLVHVPVDPVTFKADVNATRRAITNNTIMLACSAPSFPQGVIDPVSDFAELAKEFNLPLHVDCCLGSFLVACAADAGFKTPAFDFQVDGVTSISADTHKYGFAPKGSSVIMYSAEKYRIHQYFVAPDWTGGIYASPTIAGSRAGASIAGTWAALVHTGYNGYVAAAQKILRAASRIADAVRGMKHIHLLGEPDLSVVCFASSNNKLNIFNVGDEMTNRGWNLNILQNPASIHICVTYANADSAEQFITDLEEAVETVLNAPPGTYKDGMGAMYGMAETITDKKYVSILATKFLDALTAV